MDATLSLTDLLAVARRVAIEGGRAALHHYEGTIAVEHKADGSPLTLADRAAHATIVRGLAAATPAIPVLSEESAESEVAARRSWTRFWLVDPLDGTKEFLKKSGEFTVNVALVEGGAPVLGVVHAPALGVTYAAARGVGASVERTSGPQPIRTRAHVAGRTTVLASRDHAGAELEAILARIPGATRTSAGSALKFGVLAEAAADLYIRTQPTMWWDTAAGQCVVEVAGGRVTDFAGRPLVYEGESLVNPSFVAWGDAAVEWPRKLGLAP